MSHKKTRGNMLKVLLDFLLKNLPQILAFLQGKVTKEMEKPMPTVPVQVAAEPVVKPTFTLTRKQFREDGIFSELSDSKGNILAHCLEHSYNNLPKITNGVHKCVRGPHRLHNMTEDFITFEITGIEGHTNLLFHWGNYNKDSDGCVLMGEAIAETNKIEMVTNSRATFAKWMASLEGVNDFELTVI